MTLLFLESIGTTELLLILVVALVVFGPRRLPDIGRKIGKGMNEFRRASDDFKRTWEREVELERATERPRLNDSAPAVAAESSAAAEREEDSAPFVFESENSVARGRRGSSYESADARPEVESPQPETAQPAAESPAPRQEQLGKSDWL
ncbi:MAG TPA: twin-arginine translocase TatA/TatE family subunit [Pyrinomonadaceae bacterium]|nr:twin-arginine translocase TatA/TatE family subunit [Pyrinomonadaceae bacterium]